MQLISSTALRRVERVPVPALTDLHVWFCAYAPVVGASDAGSAVDPDRNARQVLAPVLRHYPQIADGTLHRSEFGKPQFASAGGLEFNLSHSGSRALVGLAQDQAIGVDLERIGRPRAVLALAQRFFCPREAAALAALPESAQQLAFLRLWTCKEAVLKALGRGIAFGLERLEFALDAHGMPLALTAIAAEGGRVADWQVVAIDPAEGYLGAIAWYGAARHVIGFLGTPDAPAVA